MLDETTAGFKVIRWSVALGEQLARHQLPFVSRNMHIVSLRGALQASSMMMVLWRHAPDATTATTKSGATALHLAAKNQVRVLS
jgi:hypothetical protein